MIDEKQILYLENLACIQLSEEQRAVFSQEIGRILEYLGNLAAIDLNTEAVSGEHAPSIGTSRADELRESLAREALLAMSPGATTEYMTVPRTVL